MKNFWLKRSSFIMLDFLLVITTFTLYAQPKEPRAVAIFLYQGVELLDFAGPGEVFSAAGFDVFTMSVEGKELVSQGFVNINPKYSIETAPVADIVVFPGGGAGPISKDPNVLKWIRERYSEGTVLMSVCTGASIIGNAGLLKNMNITTWYGFIPALQEMLPDSKVLEHTRFVDNGNIITTAGVSAGIDGALHLVSRIKGLEAAKRAAKYMEYDKWDPDNGRVDRNNELIAQLRSEATNLEKQQKLPVVEISSIKDIPYEGELKNLASEFHEAQLYAQEAYILELTVKLYPSGSAYTALAKVYSRLGKPAPMDDEQLFKMIEEGKLNEALARIEKDLKSFPDWKGMYAENRINDLGYKLIHKKQITDAIKLLQFNTTLFPQSSNAFDSLGEAYFVNENYDEAIMNYKKAIALDSGNENARQMLEKIKSKINKKS